MMGCESHYHVYHMSRMLRARVVDGLDKGIIPQTCSELFARVVDKCAADGHLKFTVEVSYIEVRCNEWLDTLRCLNHILLL
jgi:hypothetical protein